MKRLQILLLGVLCCGVLMAQPDPSPTIFSQVGKAKLMVPGVKKKMKVAPGSALGKEGTLILKKETTVGVYFDDGYTFLTGPGEFEVGPLMESSSLKESDYVGVLGNKLVQAQHPFFNQERSGFGSGGTGSTSPSTSTNSPLPPPPKPPTPGQGEKEAGIKPLAPQNGKVAAGNITFSWRPKPGNEGIKMYEVTVMDPSDKVVFRQETKANSLTVSTAQAGLTDQGTYVWRVSNKANDAVNSGPVEIDFSGSSEVDKIIDRLRQDKAYQMAGPAAKLLMEVTTLDRLDFVNEAFERLAVARKEYRKNPLVQAMSKFYDYDYGLTSPK